MFWDVFWNELKARKGHERRKVLVGVHAERARLVQENNFKQPGDRYRSFDPARKERFVKRLAEVVGDARCTKVICPLPWCQQMKSSNQAKQNAVEWPRWIRFYWYLDVQQIS